MCYKQGQETKGQLTQVVAHCPSDSGLILSWCDRATNLVYRTIEDLYSVVNKWETGTSITTSSLNSSRLGNDGASMVKENTITKEKQSNEGKYWCIFKELNCTYFCLFYGPTFQDMVPSRYPYLKHWSCNGRIYHMKSEVFTFSILR